jgi:hypothetical protein
VRLNPRATLDLMPVRGAAKEPIPLALQVGGDARGGRLCSDPMTCGHASGQVTKVPVPGANGDRTTVRTIRLPGP